MKRFFTFLFLVISFPALAQTYNNEWIRYNQTYYKFSVGKEGLYRIPKTVLDDAGLGSVSVEYFELWKNGQPVPFFPSTPSGPLPADGYIEFWGELNDGKPDKALYRDPSYQHTDKLSLQTDTAAYFLSVNTDKSGMLMKDLGNDVGSNTLAAEPYFMHTVGTYFKNQINRGKAVQVGEYIYSSSYDMGEFWSSVDIKPSTILSNTQSALFVDPTGPASTLKVGAFGNALNPRTVSIKVNNSLIKDTLMDFFNEIQASFSFPTSLISAGTAKVDFKNNSPVSNDRMVISFYEINYPRLFDFNNSKNFSFKLPPKPEGYFLAISRFNYGSTAPVLYDLTIGQRIVGNLSMPGKIRFVIPPLNTEHRFVMVNEETSNVNAVTSLSKKNFVQFNLAANQGDYLIITNPILFTGTHGNNPIEDYKAYRESTNGGSFNVKIIDINELVDQFAFGIKKHPLSIKNFLRYARSTFAKPIQFAFLIGRGMAYNEYRLHQNNAVADQLNLVPSYGEPASDNLLSSEDASSPIAVTPIGRLSVVRGAEVENYLEKIIEYENVQRNTPQTIADRSWMKNVVHVTGSSEPGLGNSLCNYMGVYRDIIEDTLFGGKVSTFCKTTTNPVEQLSSDRIEQLFEEGISILTYFGHSSSTTLEFNLDNPEAYNNQGKYPVFFVNGCNAGNFFTYYPQRMVANETLSEKFVLAKQRGSIAFVASTHFSIVNYLNLYLSHLYDDIATSDFGKPLGVLNRDALKQLVDVFGPSDFYSRLHAEEITLHGDPALRLNEQPKPDYVIEESEIKIDPAFISVAENNFQFNITMVNLGRSPGDSLTLEIKRQYPDGSTGVIFRKKVKAIRFMDSLQLEVPIIATRDKGINKLTVTIDPDNEVNEMSETNNSATKEFYIFEDEARPVFPYNYAIVTDPHQKVYVSTADPFIGSKDYIMEIDTTKEFNSLLKVSKKITSAGGTIEFDPGISYIDSTVYYWRVSVVPASGSDYHWNGFSFIYMNNSDEGWNQSHYFQHLNSTKERMSLDSASGRWQFGTRKNNFFIGNGMYPTGAQYDEDFAVTINGQSAIESACLGRSLVFNVFNPVTLKPWKNVDSSGNNLYLSGSASANCAPERNYNFEFSYMTADSRKHMMNFMDSIPDGYFVTIRSFDNNNNKSYSKTWEADTALYGSNNSLYHRLLAAGMVSIDSIDRPRAWIFMYKKNDASFAPRTKITDGIYDRVVMTFDASTPDTLGFITSPTFGPAKEWHDLIWRGKDLESPSTDNPTVEVIGVDTNQLKSVLFTLDKHTQTLDLSSVSASDFPYLQLRMRNIDSVNLTPYQLEYWRVHYTPVPEGSLVPNLFLISKDSMDVGEPFTFGVAFKNVSDKSFDSLAVRAYVLDRNNVSHEIPLSRLKPLITGDTVALKFDIETKDYPGRNTLFVEFNPDHDQPEQYQFNNFLFRNFYVRPDNTNPLLDVTFDGLHILNRDIVSAKPHIQIRLKDDAKFLLLNDTALSSVQIRYPDGVLRSYKFDNDTLRFTPATAGGNNEAVIDFTPAFTQQINPEGDEYELIVKGKDRSDNKAGVAEYRVSFKVITKPMISNLLNYPNPFSTSTAFVFTVTGSEIPQNIKIQILTITGKIVREITKEELGPIHIGRNITEFKWDGTDQFGSKLANGVYLYRVVSTLNGKKMEKYKSQQDDTDKYFTNGYGKMYIMR